MTKQKIFAVAHECAKADCRAFPDISYAQAFRNGLRGAYAAARGYDGSFVR